MPRDLPTIELHIERAMVVARELYAANDMDLKMCDGTEKMGQSGTLDNIRNDLLAMAHELRLLSSYEQPMLKSEPTFTLRAQDKFAPKIIERWASELENAVENASGKDISDLANKTRLKAKEARGLAHEMRAWQERNSCKVPD